MSEFNLLKCSRFLNSFELLGNQKKPTLIFMVIVFTISCKTKTIVANATVTILPDHNGTVSLNGRILLTADADMESYVPTCKLDTA